MCLRSVYVCVCVCVCVFVCDDVYAHTINFFVLVVHITIYQSNDTSDETISEEDRKELRVNYPFRCFDADQDGVITAEDYAAANIHLTSRFCANTEFEISTVMRAFPSDIKDPTAYLRKLAAVAHSRPIPMQRNHPQRPVVQSRTTLYQILSKKYDTNDAHSPGIPETPTLIGDDSQTSLEESLFKELNLIDLKWKREAKKNKDEQAAAAMINRQVAGIVKEFFAKIVTGKLDMNAFDRKLRSLEHTTAQYRARKPTSFGFN